MAETTSRVLALLNLLQTHRQWPGTELADRLEVTDRTLRRDIERLRDLGYRIEATRGAGGGYRLEAGSALPPLLLTDAEAVAMVVGLKLAAEQGIADSADTTLTALAKFEQVLPAALRERVRALSALSRPEVPGDAVVSPELLGQLALACRDHERIRFHYSAPGREPGERSVEPHSLVVLDRRWFLVCWDLQRDDWRSFRVDRIEDVFGTRVRFTPRELPAKDAATFVSDSVQLLRRRIRADVIMNLPISEMVERFGVWSAGAIAHSPTTTRWPLSAETPELLVGMLAWVPMGVDYRLEADDELLEFVRERQTRFARAIP